jgi:hypothetical protein
VSAYRIISAAKANGIPVSLACELLDVSRSGCYEWSTRAPSDRALTTALHARDAQPRRVRGPARRHRAPARAKNLNGMLKTLRVSNINDNYYNDND